MHSYASKLGHMQNTRTKAEVFVHGIVHKVVKHLYNFQDGGFFRPAPCTAKKEKEKKKLCEFYGISKVFQGSFGNTVISSFLPASHFPTQIRIFCTLCNASSVVSVFKGQKKSYTVMQFATCCRTTQSEYLQDRRFPLSTIVFRKVLHLQYISRGIQIIQKALNRFFFFLFASKNMLKIIRFARKFR